MSVCGELQTVCHRTYVPLSNSLFQSVPSHCYQCFLLGHMTPFCLAALIPPNARDLNGPNLQEEENIIIASRAFHAILFMSIAI